MKYKRFKINFILLERTGNLINKQLSKVDILLTTKKRVSGLVSQVCSLYEIHGALLVSWEVDESFLPLSSTAKDILRFLHFPLFPLFETCARSTIVVVVLRLEGQIYRIKFRVIFLYWSLKDCLPYDFAVLFDLFDIRERYYFWYIKYRSRLRFHIYTSIYMV